MLAPPANHGPRMRQAPEPMSAQTLATQFALVMTRYRLRTGLPALISIRDPSPPDTSIEDFSRELEPLTASC